MSPTITGLSVAWRTCRQPIDENMPGNCYATFQSAPLRHQTWGFLVETNSHETEKVATCLVGLLAQMLAQQGTM